jgi:hypothetical protein
MAKKRRETLQILRGLIGTLSVNMGVGLACVLCHSVSFLFNILLWAIGLTQFIYLIPLLILLGLQERWGLVKGVWIGAGITALTNVGYYAYFLFAVGKR